MIFKKVKAITLIWGFFFYLISCRQNSGADPAAVRQELRQREIVHLSQGQLLERAAEIADSLLLKAEADFERRIILAQKSSSCLPMLDSSIRQLENQYPVKLSYLPFSSAETNKLKNSKESALFQAYQYSKSKQLPILPNLQKDGEKEFLYTKALTLSGENCASCHRQLPQPELRGERGDTIGIRMLRLSRKQVVMSFVE